MLEGGAVAERGALELNLREHPELADLHVGHGRAAQHRVGDLARELDRFPSDEILLRAIADVNRAHADGHEPGALSEWTSTSLCGAAGPIRSIAGAAEAPCAMLDDVCARGVLRSDGCCTIEALPPGAACGDALVCSTDAECVPDAEVSESERFEGAQLWLEARPSADVSAWVLDDGAVRAAVHDGERPISVAELTARPSGGRRVHIAHSPADASIGAALSTEPAGALFLDRKTSGNVCVIANHDPDTLGEVWSDCSGEDVVELACPGRNGDISCEVRDGQAIVRGPALTLAWERQDIRVLGIMFTILGRFPCSGLGCLVQNPRIRLPTVACRRAFAGRACNFRGPSGNVCAGTFLCVGPGSGLPLCMPASGFFEQCNGLDDDCDGVIDEDANRWVQR